MLVGVTFSVGMLVVSLFANDSVDYMIKKQYYLDQRYDYLVRFASPVKENSLLDISRIEGVVKSEALFEIPVKVYFQGKSQEDTLQGIPPDSILKRLDQGGRPKRSHGSGK